MMAEPAKPLFLPREIAARHLFAAEPPELLFHYTTIGGAYGIVTSEALWMTKINYLNDTSELEIGIATFHRVLDDLLQQPAPTDETELLTQVKSGLGRFAASNICIASFCEHGDLLSQWRWYGEGGRGVSLGVSSNVLYTMAKGAINLWKCIYDEHAHRELLEALVAGLVDAYRSERGRSGGALTAEGTHKLLERFFVSFLSIAPIIKNPHFAEEREWRLVSSPVDIDDPAYGVAVFGERIIQRYELSFPREADGWCRAIPSVVVGPTKDPGLIGEAIALLCRKKQIECRTISYSNIPFRHT
ncbi:MAG: DUF2971 domain-containing protein [Burkholderiales bacterium]